MPELSFVRQPIEILKTLTPEQKGALQHIVNNKLAVALAVLADPDRGEFLDDVRRSLQELALQIREIAC